MASDQSRRQFLGSGAKLLGLTVLAGVTPELLSACGSSASKSSSTTAAASTPAAASTSSLSGFLKSAGKKYSGTSLNLLCVSSAQASAIQSIVSEFEDLTGIKVSFSMLANSAAITKTSVSLDAKSSAYDIYQIQSFYVPQYVAAGYFVSADELKAKSGVTYAGLDLTAYAPSSLSALTDAGHLVALPMFNATQVVFYRTDIFKSAKINGIPSTLQQLEQVCAQIHGAGHAAIALRTSIGSTENLFTWTAWLYNFGGGYYRSYDASTGKYSGPNLSAKESLAAGQLYIDVMRKYGPSGALNWGVSEVTKAFLSGQVAMIQEGSPFGGTINDPKTSAVAGKVGAFAIPPGPAGSYYPSAAQGWGVSSYSKNQEAAWLFSQWATAPETLLKATLAADFTAPPTNSAFSNSAFVKKYDFPGFLNSLKQSYGAAKSSPIGGSYIPSLSNWQAAGQQVSTYFNEAINNQRTLASAFTAADGTLTTYA